jgi:DNA-binding transcriptional ArsR family regulator
MARLATSTDVFNAVAEPRRRRILSLLKSGERSVNDVARSLRVTQPLASKHLGVLRRTGLVRVRGEGQRRLYALNGNGLRPMHDWVKTFEATWNARFDRLAEYLDELQKTDADAQQDPTK